MKLIFQIFFLSSYRSLLSISHLGARKTVDITNLFGIVPLVYAPGPSFCISCVPAPWSEQWLVHRPDCMSLVVDKSFLEISQNIGSLSSWWSASPFKVLSNGKLLNISHILCRLYCTLSTHTFRMFESLQNFSINSIIYLFSHIFIPYSIP